MYQRTYSDQQLVDAVSSARSWRDVLRRLGLSATSAGSARSVRQHADRLGLSYAHFTGQRRWSDSSLRAAVSRRDSWTQVAEELGLSPIGGSIRTLRAHAERLGLSTSHFVRSSEPTGSTLLAEFRPECLRDAGSLFAATWFALRGAKVAWPLEPCRYDLVVELGGKLKRVQVKTTTQGAGQGAVVALANSRKSGGYVVYAPGEIDDFFILDADLNAYVIPYEVVAGYRTIQLNRYRKFLVAEKGSLLAA